jgi:hypothetical protein
MANHLTSYTELWGRLVPSHEWMHNVTMTECRRCSGSSRAKPKYKHTQSFQHDWCSTDTSMKNFEPWWFISLSFAKSITPLTMRTPQPCMILWTMATHSVWHSVQGWSFNYLEWYMDAKKSHSWAY